MRSWRNAFRASVTVFPTVVPSDAASRFSSSWVATSMRTLVLCMQFSIHTAVSRTEQGWGSDYEGHAMATITPFLWFDGDLAEPIAFYRSIFGDATAGEPSSTSGPVYSATIELCGQPLMLLNGGPAHAGFTESISLFVSVDTQMEVDDLWSQLTADGGEEGRCGWLKDRYGLSWQIVPTVLGGLLGSPDRVRAQQAIDAMLQMNRLDIAALQAAFDR
jgi:predicted 3-demethylubiquinone-9 3-methyltransferase (glyoxalase superfamily)